MSETGIITIHGKAYETVALRVQKFRAKFPDYTLSTQVVERTEEVVVVKATISDEMGRVRATGHAEEFRKSSQINRTSALENAETSAIGRALASLGLGGTEFATANEVQNAIHQQGKGVHKPSDGAWEALTPARQKVVADTAPLVKDALAEGRDFDAYSLCEDFTVPEEKIALWTMLDSKERRRIKEQAALAKQKEAA